MPPSDTPPPLDQIHDQVLVPLRLVRVVLRERSDQQWIFLQEDAPDKPGLERGFPIVIGTGEASEIHRLVTGVTPARPLTHQLMADAVQALGSRVIGVDIVDLRSNTFYAQLRLAKPDAEGGEVRIDARPSDALAIALRTKASIRVAESVLEQVRSDKAQDVLPNENSGELEVDPTEGLPGDMESGPSDVSLPPQAGPMHPDNQHPGDVDPTDKPDENDAGTFDFDA